MSDCLTLESRAGLALGIEAHGTPTWPPHPLKEEIQI